MKFAVFVALLACPIALLAQSRPIAGSLGPDDGFPAAPGSRGMDPSAGFGPKQIALVGKVQVADGAALDAPVRIERVCSGVPHAEGFTDLKGNFSITLGQEQTAMADASEAGGRSASTPGASGGSMPDLTNCELRASLTGYRSDVVSLASRRYLDSPNIGTIFLHRQSNVEGLTMSATTALAPKDARKAYEKALEAERKNKVDDAQKDFERAVAIYPRFAAAWFELGKVYEQRDHIDQAGNAYRQSLAADSKYLHPYERLYVIAFNAEKWQEAADLTDRLVRLDPADHPEAYYFNAVANLRLNRLDTAEKSAREAVTLDTSHHDAKSYYTLGFILAQRGNYTEAAQYLRTYLELEPDGKQAAGVRKQLGDIEHAAQAQH